MPHSYSDTGLPLLPPLLGIFWLRNGRVIAFTSPADEVIGVAGTKDSNFAHADQWADVIKRYAELREREYWFLERGRVLYRAKEKLFCIFASTAVAGNQRLIDAIIRRFRLPPTQVRALADLHYDPPTDELFED